MLLLVDLFLNQCYKKFYQNGRIQSPSISLIVEYYYFVGSEPHATTSNRVNEIMKLFRLPQILYDRSLPDSKPQLIAQRTASTREWCPLEWHVRQS